MRETRPPEERGPSVLYLIATLDPRTGGPAASAPNIWKSARRAQVHVTVALAADASDRDGEARILDGLHPLGIDVHAFAASRVNRLRHWGFSIPLALWVLRSAKDYDVIHAHGGWTFTSVLGLVAARLRRRSFVLTPHESLTDSDLVKGASRVKHLVKRFLRNRYLRSADRIIVASGVERDASIPVPARAIADILYHPVLDDPSALPPPRPAPLERGAVRVGFLGRFDPKKNLEFAIDAVAGLPQAALHIAGGGDPSYEARLRRLAAASGGAERMHWHGFIAAADRPAFFDRIDLLAMPSRFEGFGMVAAEAMCHGVPVVVAEATGIAELVRRYHCGLVVPASANGLRTALVQVLAEPAMLSRFSAGAIEAVRRELTFDSYGARLAAIYRGLAKSTAPRGGAVPHRSAM